MNIRYKGKKHTVFLCDSGTLDTEIEVDGKRHVFSQEHVAPYRKRDGTLTEHGLRQLAFDVLDYADD